MQRLLDMGRPEQQHYMKKEKKALSVFLSRSDDTHLFTRILLISSHIRDVRVG